eukprot:m.82894 g.82894  ORF g.82894 m.82894 type:complete len:377 (+) comp14637_c0_seq2:135-1265(+)
MAFAVPSTNNGEQGQPPVKRAKELLDSQAAQEKKMQHRRTEAIRRNRINTALTRLRSLAGVGERTEKSEVLELSVSMLEQQAKQIADLQQVADLTANAFAATSPACSSESSASILADDTLGLSSIASLGATIDTSLLEMDLELPGSAMLESSSTTQPSMLMAADTQLTTWSQLTTANSTSTLSQSCSCATRSTSVLSLPTIPRSSTATAELLQFASIQLPSLDSLNIPVPIGLCYVAASTTVLDTNDTFLAMLQYSRHDAIGQKLMELVSFPDSAMASKARSDLVNGNRHTVRTIERIRLKNGTILWFRKTLTRKGYVPGSVYGPELKYAFLTFEPMPEPAGGACELFDQADIAGPDHPLCYENLMGKSTKCCKPD